MSVSDDGRKTVRQAATDARIHPIWATFAGRDLESAFRQSCLRDDTRQMLLVGAFFLACMPFFIISDLHVTVGNDALRLTLLLLDRAAIFLCIGTAGLLLAKNRDVSAVDRVAVAACVLIAASTLHIDSTRPPDYLAHIGVDAIIVLGFYLIVPIPLARQLVPAAFFTLGLLVLHFALKDPPYSFSSFAVTTCLFAANFLGILGSRRIAISRRTQYLNWRNENTLRLELSDALANVHALSGLLPICSACKKVRDDKNYWHSIEAFLSERSELDFTHSICPDCERRLYPDLQDDSDGCAARISGGS